MDVIIRLMISFFLLFFNEAFPYKVEKYKLLYEPTYVSRGDTPFFDERFIGFGFTRNSQVRDINQWCLVFSNCLQVHEMWVSTLGTKQILTILGKP